MRRSLDLSLYLVLDPDLCAPIGMAETARQAAAAGATAIQLRHKTASTALRIALGREILAAIGGRAAFIVNDDAEAAVALGADGLHIGQNDIAPSLARSIIGAKMQLGLSCESPERAVAVDRDIVDHIGAGPVFATATKSDHEPPIGLDGLGRVVAASPVPAVAIGGLKMAHVADVFAAGAAGLAVVSAICGTPDPGQATRALAETLDTERKRRAAASRGTEAPV